MTPPLPPGNPGLPFIGETLALLANPYQFQMERRARYGPVFRSRILGREFVFLSGPEGMEAFLDPDRVSRQNGHPAHVRELFGGKNMGMLDGNRPIELKRVLLAAFSPDALQTYLPQLQELVGAELRRWSAAGSGLLEAELQRLAVSAIARNVLGLSPGPEVDVLFDLYLKLTPGFLAPPVNLPGTTFRASVLAKEQVLARLRAAVADHRANPRDDGLSRALAVTATVGGVSDEELVLELNHMFIAGYIVYALLAELMLRLDADPTLKDRALAELDASGPLTIETLAGMQLFTHLVMEAKRTAPIVPFAFGSARRSFTYGGYTIPEGWGVQMALTLSNSDPTVFTDPERFDPDRYAAPRQEHLRHPHAWHPQGSGPPQGHRCLGVEYSTLMAEVFLIELLRGYRWSFPKQDLSRRWNLIPAGFVDGLQVELRPR